VRREEDLVKDCPANLSSSEASLILAGFDIAPRAAGRSVLHLCANCCWFDDTLDQRVRSMARQHSMAFCRRPGGGGVHLSLDELIDGQRAADEEMIQGSRSAAGNPRSQRSEALRQGNDRGLNFRR
jgi:hypothetical protein